METPSKPPAATKFDPHTVQNGWLKGHRDKLVAARLTCGVILRGTLLCNDTFTILLRPANEGSPILIYKQAIAYLYKATEKAIEPEAKQPEVPRPDSALIYSGA